MKYEEIMCELRAGKQVVNEGWNGVKLPGRIMYLRLQCPDENSLNTEPYIMMYSLRFVKKDEPCVQGEVQENQTEAGGWVSRRFPWTPSALDLMSEKWEVREMKEEK